MKKHFNKLLATFLAITLVITVITVPTSVNAEIIDGINHISDLSDAEIKELDKVSITDKEMLDDIIERSYQNDFQIKNYIIKTEKYNLNTTYWDNYIHSLGDVYISITWSIIDDVFDTDTNSYYTVKLTPKPFNIDFDSNTRTIKRWNEYNNKIKQIENEICILNDNLCDYQQIQIAYMWIKEHVIYGTIDGNYESETAGQTALEAILDKHALCAGYSRLFNRFMHDCNINSYWISRKDINHAHNIVELHNAYHTIDMQASTLALYPEKNHNGKELWAMDGGPGYLDLNGLNNMFEYPAINYYYKLTHNNKDLPYCDTPDGEHCPIFSYPVGTKPEITINPDGTRHFLKEGEIDKECDYCHKVHEFDVPALPDTPPEPTTPEVTTPEPTTPETTTVPETSHDVVTDKPTENPTSEPVTTPKPVETTDAPVTTKPQPTTTEPVVTTTKPVVTTKVPATTPTPTTTKPVVTTKPTITKIATPSKVKPKATNIKTKSIKLTWKKTKNAKKYQIQYSTDKKFKKKVKTKTINALKYTIKKLTKKKTYYVRIRGVNGIKYGKWSSVKKVKIKK